MTLYQFTTLDEMEQADAIWEKAVFLCYRTETEYKHILYQVGSFYAEFHFHTGHNILKRVRVFENTAHLQPYLDQMTIIV